jgi:hypothetical protein
MVTTDHGDRQNVTATIIRRSIAPSHAVIVPSVTMICHHDLEGLIPTHVNQVEMDKGHQPQKVLSQTCADKCGLREAIASQWT